MAKFLEQPFTVTYAMYDEAPIACQGDDDQKRIRVIKDYVSAKDDVYAEALRRSVALSELHETYVQVWGVERRADT